MWPGKSCVALSPHAGEEKRSDGRSRGDSQSPSRGLSGLVSLSLAGLLLVLLRGPLMTLGVIIAKTLDMLNHAVLFCKGRGAPIMVEMTSLKKLHLSCLVLCRGCTWIEVA